MLSRSWLQSAKQIIGQYDGNIPLAAWLKNYFREHKKFGSKDRKQVAQLCYAWYRLGHALTQLPFEERMITAHFLCSPGPDIILREQMPEWNEKTFLPLEQKLEIVNAKDKVPHIFPHTNLFSPEIDPYQYALSLLIQPLLFLRIRPGYETLVPRKLEEAGLSFEQRSPHCLALPNSTKTEDILLVDKEVVIQDANSQKALDLLDISFFRDRKISVWDCCAASGGKSLLLHDRYPKTDLLVSDLRNSIIHNLRNRFERAGIRSYRSQVLDAAGQKPAHEVDLVVLDAPCSGSGTWSRTPEQLYFFKQEKVNHYSSLQKKIGKNVSGSVKQQGWLVYITCSVFKEENEEVVSYLEKETGLQLHAMQYFKGYEERADTLFAAVFKRL